MLNTLANILGPLCPYRVCIRFPVGHNGEYAFNVLHAITEAQGLRLLHESGQAGTLSKWGKLVALRAGSDALKSGG